MHLGGQQTRGACSTGRLRGGRGDAARGPLGRGRRCAGGRGAPAGVLAPTRRARTNTMHKVADRIEAAVRIPLLHIVDATAAALVAAASTAWASWGPRSRWRRSCTGPPARAVRHRGPRARRGGPRVVHRVIYDELLPGLLRPESKAAYTAVMRTWPGRARRRSCSAVRRSCRCRQPTRPAPLQHDRAARRGCCRLRADMRRLLPVALVLAQARCRARAVARRRRPARAGEEAGPGVAAPAYTQDDPRRSARSRRARSPSCPPRLGAAAGPGLAEAETIASATSVSGERASPRRERAWSKRTSGPTRTASRWSSCTASRCSTRSRQGWRCRARRRAPGLSDLEEELRVAVGLLGWGPRAELLPLQWHNGGLEKGAPMPRVVRCGLIQASNVKGPEAGLPAIKKAMVDKHVKLIEQGRQAEGEDPLPAGAVLRPVLLRRAGDEVVPPDRAGARGPDHRSS